jgi:hypothetical protein
MESKTIMQKKVNPWLLHVQKFRAENPGMSYKMVLQEAKKTYVKKAENVKGGSVKSEQMVEKKVEKKKPDKKEKKPKAKKGGRLSAGQSVKKLHIEPIVDVDHVTEENIKKV